ncbi:hypothetical protein BV25DRAFT_997701 [Artomyces pyxidatus]|uniref:Uncharacterized protein n=1 Tax=Artomyces pyxidatus TaxID=48021 RepID=A0ACB8SVU2_9AGAM|nr:hypothetical protein BV25DRAFT_997701 [Artomyces pyxidatus]
MRTRLKQTADIRDDFAKNLYALSCLAPVIFSEGDVPIFSNRSISTGRDGCVISDCRLVEYTRVCRESIASQPHQIGSLELITGCSTDAFCLFPCGIIPESNLTHKRTRAQAWEFSTVDHWLKTTISRSTSPRCFLRQTLALADHTKLWHATLRRLLQLRLYFHASITGSRSD